MDTSKRRYNTIYRYIATLKNQLAAGKTKDRYGRDIAQRIEDFKAELSQRNQILGITSKGRTSTQFEPAKRLKNLRCNYYRYRAQVEAGERTILKGRPAAEVLSEMAQEIDDLRRELGGDVG